MWSEIYMTETMRIFQSSILQNADQIFSTWNLSSAKFDIELLIFGFWDLEALTDSLKRCEHNRSKSTLSSTCLCGSGMPLVKGKFWKVQAFTVFNAWFSFYKPNWLVTAICALLKLLSHKVLISNHNTLIWRKYWFASRSDIMMSRMNSNQALWFF